MASQSARQNLRQKMGRSDKIDIVHSLALQPQHPGRQLPGGNLLAVAKLADREVLAEKTAKRAAGKKDGAGALCSGYRRLFPPVDAGCGNFGEKSRTAHASLAGNPVDTAVMGAEITAAQALIGRLYPLQQLT